MQVPIRKGCHRNRIWQPPQAPQSTCSDEGTRGAYPWSRALPSLNQSTRVLSPILNAKRDSGLASWREISLNWPEGRLGPPAYARPTRARCAARAVASLALSRPTRLPRKPAVIPKATRKLSLPWVRFCRS